MKFVTRWGAFADVMVFAVRKAAWDAWPEERRALVRGAAEQAAREANALAREEAALAQLTKDGVTIRSAVAGATHALRDAAQPAIDAWTVGWRGTRCCRAGGGGGGAQVACVRADSRLRVRVRMLRDARYLAFGGT